MSMFGMCLINFKLIVIWIWYYWLLIVIIHIACLCLLYNLNRLWPWIVAWVKCAHDNVYQMVNIDFIFYREFDLMTSKEMIMTTSDWRNSRFEKMAIDKICLHVLILYNGWLSIFPNQNDGRQEYVSATKWLKKTDS